MKSLSVTIQMKATKLYFPVVLFIIHGGSNLNRKSVPSTFYREGSQ